MTRLCFKFFVGVAALILFSVLCNAADKQATHAPEWAKLLDQATKIEAVLLTDDEHGIKERTERHTIDQQTADKFKKLFQADTNWPDYLDMCDPNYGARLIFTLKAKTESETNTLAVDICFSCNDISATQNGKWFGGRKFSGNRDLLKFFHDSFPNDKQLPSVK